MKQPRTRPQGSTVRARTSYDQIVLCHEGNDLSFFHELLNEATVGCCVLILFVPDMPVEKQEAINSISLGSVNKITLEFSDAFWPSDVFEIQLTGQADTGFSCFQSYVPILNRNTLVCLVGGSFATTIESWTDKNVVQGP